MDFNHVKLFSRNHTGLHSQTMLPTMKYYSTSPKFENFDVPLLQHLTASQSEKKFTNPNFVMPNNKVVFAAHTMLSIIPNMADESSTKTNKHKKSPNMMFYRNVIEELTERKKVSREEQEPSTHLPPSPPESVWVEPSTIEYQILPKTNNCWEIRFCDAKDSKPDKPKHKVRCKPSQDNQKHFQSESKLPMFLSNFLDEFDDETSSNHSSITPEDDDSEDSYYPKNMENQHRRASITDGDSSDDCIVFADDDDDDETDVPVVTFSKVVNKRVRCLSDCESEDSFIMFADNNEHVYEDDDEEDDTEGDDESSDCDDDDEMVDEPDCMVRRMGSCVLRNVCKLVNSYPGPEKTQKKVQFKPDPELATIHPLITWSYAYQSARKGNWEEAVRDRARFQCRIRRTSDTLKQILTPEHRCRIYAERFLDQS